MTQMDTHSLTRKQGYEEKTCLCGGLPADREKAIEFAGWLPIYEISGNCGAHPQFAHIEEPPRGYRFTCSNPLPARNPNEKMRAVSPLLVNSAGAKRQAKIVHALTYCWGLIRPLFALFRPVPGCGLRVRLRTLWSILTLFFKLRRRGVRLGPILRFLQTRHWQSQLLLARSPVPVFLTSIPYTYGQNPWVVEIEDPTTLFYPFIPNGATGKIYFAASPYYPIIKTLLESDQCKGIITHMQATADMIPTLFASETITKKVFYAPLGVKLPERWQRHEAQEEAIHLLFTNSWSGAPLNFFMRGGLDVLEAFAILKERYPQLRLTLRSNLPDLDLRYRRIMEQGWVRVIDRFLPLEEMDELLAGSHIFLLPAARVHIVSLLQAMSYGLAVVASDGWGFDEIVETERNGLIVPGRYGKVSWTDPKAGCLREDYQPMCTCDPVMVEGIVDAVSRLVEDRMLRRRIGLTARRDVETNHSLERWNAGLKMALDKTFLARSASVGTSSHRSRSGLEKQINV